MSTFNLPPGSRVIPNSLTSGGASNPGSCEGKLDRFGLVASQHYNFGNASNWFFSFRQGMAGVSERLAGLRIHTAAVHEWLGSSNPIFIDHHVVIILFCMDSAIECFTFMLNALGQTVDRQGFRDISTIKGLRGISPSDVIGRKGADPLSGYGKLFPTVQSYWLEKAEMIDVVTANHDVSKHRHTPATSWLNRADPPEGYFEAMGLGGSSMDMIVARLVRTPLKTFHLRKSPKLPVDDPNNKEFTSLEELEDEFAKFIPKSFCLAYEDAQSTIVLRDSSLHH